MLLLFLTLCLILNNSVLLNLLISLICLKVVSILHLKNDYGIVCEGLRIPTLLRVDGCWRGKFNFFFKDEAPG